MQLQKKKLYTENKFLFSFGIRCFIMIAIEYIGVYVLSVQSGGSRRRGRRSNRCSWISITGGAKSGEDDSTPAGSSSNEERTASIEGREDSRQRGCKQKRDSVRSVLSSTSSCKSEFGLDSPDSSECDSVDSDDEQQLLSTHIAAQIDVKIWQNMYIEFTKLLPNEELGFENMSVHLQSSVKSDF